MRGYLHRLIDRAGSTAVPPVVTRAPAPVDDPFERVVEEPARPRAVTPVIAPAVAPPPVTRIEREERVVHEPARVIEATPPTVASPLETRHEVTSESTVTRIVEPAPPPAVMRELARESVVHEVRTHELRMPGDREHTTTTEKWLTPEPPRIAPQIVEPATAPPPHIVPLLQPAEPAPAASPPPMPEQRPSLSIGRVVVEVRQQPAAPAPVAPVQVRAAAPSTSAPLPSVVHRSFGLGQS